MTMAVYEADYGPCPYLPGRSWRTRFFSTKSLPPVLYETILPAGWRRSGRVFYQNQCAGCNACVPIRVPVDSFVPSKSQRHVANRNADVRMTVESSEFDDEVFDLYARYVVARHGKETPDPASFKDFLVESPLEMVTTRYRVGRKLIGVGWCDVLPRGLSSVYFAFEPEEAKRSLGVLSVLREIELARDRELSYYYLGFWVENSKTMGYKANYRPHEIAVDGEWRPAE